MKTHETYLVRVSLPDRPGALGLVASRLGALKGDLVGLEIIERGGGVAVDELVVSLPIEVSIDLIIKEVGAEDGAAVEDVRLLEGSTYDPQLDVLEAASIVLGAETREDLAAALTEHVCRAVRSSWACVVEQHGATVLAAFGDRPSDRWLASFISGHTAGDAERSAFTPAVDTIWIPLPAASVALVVGRDGVIRARERQRLAALARIADAWFRRMKERSDATARALHPSRG